MSLDNVSFVSDFRYYSLSDSIQKIYNNEIPQKSTNNVEYDFWNKNNDMYEYLDGWIHFINVSNWNKKGDKIQYIQEFCNLLLNNDKNLFTNIIQSDIICL